MRLLYFNPENDLALAANDPHYTPPASALQMATDLQSLPLLWAEPDDLILQRDRISNLPTPIFLHSTLNSTPSTLNSTPSTLNSQLSTLNYKPLPWGWSPLLVRQLKDVGVPAELLPTPVQLADYRSFASRQTAVRLLERLRRTWPEAFHSGSLVGKSTWCESEAEVFRAITNHGTMLKAPWSGSGRGVHPVGDHLSEKDISWIRRTLQRQGGVEVEPYYDKIQDFAMEFWAEDGRVSYEGLSLFTTTDGGVYHGNLVATEEEKERRLARYISVSLLYEVRHALTELLSSADFPTWYTGPLGIDMMVVAHPHPLPREGNSNSLPSSLSSSSLPISPPQGGDGGGLLHPLVEINLRMTMGWVACQLTQQLMTREVGHFSIRHQQGRYQALFTKESQK